VIAAVPQIPARRAAVLEAIFAGPGAPVALLDAARSQRVLRLIRSVDGARILYEGKIAPGIADVAPYLVPADPKSRVVEQLVAYGWGNSWGVFCKSKVGVDDLRRHLRKFLTVKTEGGKKMLFRFYDPRVLRVYLPTCTPVELQTFFGPVERFVIESRDAGKAIVHRRAGEGFAMEEVAL
jgi:hypothetical protein